MTIRAGIIGLSEGNGHPFSFSAILNGYSESAMARAGWPVIHQYLRLRDASDYGGMGMEVTHAWTQDPDTTQRLCAACNIPHGVASPSDMLASIDAVILARDDHEQHLDMALPFLKAGLHVFVDKPLTLVPAELATFSPYLVSGQLMSCSGMRFARELDEARANIDSYGTLRLVRGAILNGWEKYGIHLIDAILPLLRARPISVTALKSGHESLAIEMDDGSLLQIDALGDIGRCFRIDLFGTGRISSHEINDNFSMFRRLLFHFSESIRRRQPVIPAGDTLTAIKLLISGRQALARRRTVRLDEAVQEAL